MSAAPQGVKGEVAHKQTPTSPNRGFDLRCFTSQGYEARLIKFHLDMKTRVAVIDSVWKIGEAFKNVDKEIDGDGIYRHEEEFFEKCSDEQKKSWTNLLEMTITVGGKRSSWGEFAKVTPEFNAEEKEVVKKIKLRRLAEMM